VVVVLMMVMVAGAVAGWYKQHIISTKGFKKQHWISLVDKALSHLTTTG